MKRLFTVAALAALLGGIARASSDTVTVTRTARSLEWLASSDYRLCVIISSSNGGSKIKCATLKTDGSRSVIDDNGTSLGTLSAGTMTDLATCKTDIDSAVTTLEGANKLPL